MVDRAKDIVSSMIVKDLGHCGAIASSAITLAAERSVDIEVPVIATFIMLKVLCEKNIQVQIDIPAPPEVERLSELLGKDHKQIQKEGIEALESVVNDYFDETGGKRVNIQ